MKQLEPIDPNQFIDLVRPPLEAQDSNALAGLIQQYWSIEQIIQLLESSHTDARKLAALALGFIGNRRCIVALAARLRDEDPIVNQMAEHALWNLWFRCGTQKAQEQLQAGSQFLSAKRLLEAEEKFTLATHLDPTYAEAYNQRAITRYFSEDFPASIADCQRTVKLMPCHFGAWAGLGHCHAHLGHTAQAIDAYQRAIAINPRLHGLCAILHELYCKG